MNMEAQWVNRCQRGSLPFFPGRLRSDGHADTLREMVLSTARHVDLDGLHEHVDLQFLAIYVSEEAKGNLAYAEERKLLSAAKEILAKREDTLFSVHEGLDLGKIGQGRTGVVLAMENCASFDGDLSRVEAYYQDGYRSFGLTWNHANCIGGGVAAPETGLTPFGRGAVKSLLRLPVLVDLAHAGEKLFYDVLQLGEKPPFYSHGCCYGRFPHRRNLKDEQMKALAAAGGLFGLTFCKHFLGDGEVGIDDVMNHLVYAADLIGVAALCFGTDFDGTDLPRGIEGPQDWPKIEEAMVGRGFLPHEIDAICGENLLRFTAAAFAARGG